MKTVLHFVFVISGIIFILIGIAGLFLPIIPGIILIILGLIVMGKKDLVTYWLSKLPSPLNKVIIIFKK